MDVNPTNPSPLKRAFVCPLCGDIIDALEPHETINAPHPKDWDYSLGQGPEGLIAFRAAQNMEANEALIWGHFESSHTLKEAVLALGAARTALMEIHAEIAKCDGTGHRPRMPQFLRDDLTAVVERGLGGK